MAQLGCGPSNNDNATSASDAGTGEELWATRHDEPATGPNRACDTAVIPDGDRAIVRWMQDTRRFKPSTMSRRFSVVVAGFYRTAVIDGVLDRSRAEHVRRRVVPPESPTLGDGRSTASSERPCCRHGVPATVPAGATVTASGIA
jgi:hypothetical protein